MSATATPETMNPNAIYEPDPREVLDAHKKAEVTATIKLGFSRRIAASIAGCHHATIARTAERGSSSNRH